MANIAINDLAKIDLENQKSIGSDLFDDSESFMIELSDEENTSILGGCTFTDCGATVIICTRTLAKV